MPDVTMTVLRDGHVRLTVDDAHVEIIGPPGGLFVAAQSGIGQALTYGTRPAPARALVPASAPAPRGMIPASMSLSNPPGLSPASMLDPEFADAPIPRAEPQPVPPEEWGRKGPARKQRPRIKGGHQFGVTAPSNNNPVRYAVALIRGARTPHDKHRLNIQLNKINRMTGMRIARAPDETVHDAFTRAKAELEAWFEVYCAEHGMALRLAKRKPRAKA